ncbi:putative ABC transporter ATP-binding protein [Chlamydia trachomatis]|nr:putative ABC transporter ATP-binding protein [Chlamydia trachomatis]
MAKDLSGGQMQRVALARTLAQKPKIILADEPVGALDPIMAKSVMDGFLIANKSERITIVANLHHVDLALQYADRIVGVKKGKIIFNDS